jgi:hypothetical protein
MIEFFSTSSEEIIEMENKEYEKYFIKIIEKNKIIELFINHLYENEIENKNEEDWNVNTAIEVVLNLISKI